VSVNSDEIAEGILKAVGSIVVSIVVSVGVAFFAVKFPWLLLFLIPVLIVTAICVAVWHALMKVGARTLAVVGHTSFGVGVLLFSSLFLFLLPQFWLPEFALAVPALAVLVTPVCLIFGAFMLHAANRSELEQPSAPLTNKSKSPERLSPNPSSKRFDDEMGRLLGFTKQKE
jgi:hypothetical protein